MKIIASNKDGDIPVIWFKKGKKAHVIEYGKQRKTFFDDLEACHEFGECVRHSLECEGKLDWTDAD